MVSGPSIRSVRPEGAEVDKGGVSSEELVPFPARYGPGELDNRGAFFARVYM